MSEKFSLKWNDFHDNVSKSFGVFRNSEYLHDVTLVSDDFKHAAAHKLVLSACSEYFRNIFEHTKESKPLICLEGLGSKDIQSILDYVYDGEVKIYQDDLERFLSIAGRLKLSGLIGDEDQEENLQIISESHEDNNMGFKQQQHYYEKTIVPNAPVPVLIKQKVENPREIIDLHNATSDEEQAFVEDNIEKISDGTFACKICGKVSSRKTNMRIHMQTHMNGSYPCIICGKTYRSKNCLSNHFSRHHRK